MLRLRVLGLWAAGSDEVPAARASFHIGPVPHRLHWVMGTPAAKHLPQAWTNGQLGVEQPPPLKRKQMGVPSGVFDAQPVGAPFVFPLRRNLSLLLLPLPSPLLPLLLPLPLLPLLLPDPFLFGAWLDDASAE